MDGNGPITESVVKKIRRFENGVDENEDVSDLSKAQMESRRREMDAYRKVRAAIKTLADTINSYSRDSLIRTAFIDEMTHTHRHLQGLLIEELLYSLGDYGGMFKEDPMRFADGRNEFHMKLLLTLRERLKDELFWKDK